MKMRQKPVSRIWVMLLIIAMLTTYSMAGAFAAEPEPPGDITVKTQDGTETAYDTLFEAVDAAGDGDTVLLYDDVEMGFFQLDGRRQNPTMWVDGKSITLDGQGHTVTAKNEAFSMIEVRPAGKITVKNIVLDGSSAENRSFSNIINIEGGEAYIEDGAVLTNNRTAAVSIGTNVPGGKCVMNGGTITGNVMPAGSNDTGVAVTVLGESTFIMNGGTISGNRTETYGSSGIMANRGGKVILNGGIIENNATAVRGMASAVHIKGGEVEINDGVVIRNNTSVTGYGAIYVTDHSSFGVKWDGILRINGGQIVGNKDDDGKPNAIYLWNRSSIADQKAAVYFSGSPEIEGPSIIMANSSADVDYEPIQVDGSFDPVRPVVLDPYFYYIIGQTMVEYADGVTADSDHFAAPVDNYGFQEDKENNLLYTEQKRYVDFWDNGHIIKGLSYWEFVEDYVTQPEVDKAGYTLEGWYTDKELTDRWDFSADKLERSEDTFNLHARWELIPATAPDLPAQQDIQMGCGDEEYDITAPDFEKLDGYKYTYEWKDAEGNTVGEDELLTVTLEKGGDAVYTLTVTAERTDNGQKAYSQTAFNVTRSDHEWGGWEYDETHHYKECAQCKAVTDEAIHEFEWVTDKEPNGTQPGSKHEECTICGYEKDPVEIPGVPADTPDDTDDETTDTPKTGQPDEMTPWLIVLAFSAAGMTGAIAVGRKKNIF